MRIAPQQPRRWSSEVFADRPTMIVAKFPCCPPRQGYQGYISRRPAFFDAFVGREPNPSGLALPIMKPAKSCDLRPRGVPAKWALGTRPVILPAAAGQYEGRECLRVRPFVAACQIGRPAWAIRK